MSYPLPASNVPVINPKTGLMTEPWYYYFSNLQAQQGQNDPGIPAGGSGGAGMGQTAEALAIAALSRGVAVPRGTDPLAISQRGSGIPVDHPALWASSNRAWSEVNFITDTAANQANYAPSAYYPAIYLETDNYNTYYSTGAAWVLFLFPQMIRMGGATSSFPAWLRSSAILQAKLADGSAYTDVEVLDEAYDATTWNGSVEVPTKNALRDKIEALYGGSLQFGSNTDNPIDATTYFIGNQFALGGLQLTGLAQIYIPKAGTIKAAYASFINSVVGSNENSTISIRLNNSTDTTIVSTVDNSNAAQNVSNTALSISVAAGDYIEIKWVTPTWATNPTGVYVRGLVYLE